MHSACVLALPVGSVPPPQPHEVSCPGAAVYESGRGLVLAKLGSRWGGAPGAPRQTGVRGLPPRCSTENTRNPRPQQRGSCPESLTDFSSSPSASLDVVTLAPGAFPILLARNVLIWSLPSSSTLGDGVGVAHDSRTLLEEAGSLVAASHSRGLRAPTGGTSLCNPGGAGRRKGGGGSEDPRPRARSHSPHGKEIVPQDESEDLGTGPC